MIIKVGRRTGVRAVSASAATTAAAPSFNGRRDGGRSPVNAGHHTEGPSSHVNRCHASGCLIIIVGSRTGVRAISLSAATRPAAQSLSAAATMAAARPKTPAATNAAPPFVTRRPPHRPHFRDQRVCTDGRGAPWEGGCIPPPHGPPRTGTRRRMCCRSKRRQRTALASLSSPCRPQPKCANQLPPVARLARRRRWRLSGRGLRRLARSHTGRLCSTARKPPTEAAKGSPTDAGRPPAATAIASPPPFHCHRFAANTGRLGIHGGRRRIAAAAPPRRPPPRLVASPPRLTQWPVAQASPPQARRQSPPRHAHRHSVIDHPVA